MRADLHQQIHFYSALPSYWRGKAGEWKEAAQVAKDELEEFQVIICLELQDL